MKMPCEVFVYRKTNEAFVADGYGNRRVVVFDADTGAFKRMWGAFGNMPLDPPPRGQQPLRPARPRARARSNSERCTASRCRTTVSSMSLTATISAFRCSRSTGST